MMTAGIFTVSYTLGHIPYYIVEFMPADGIDTRAEPQGFFRQG